MHLEEIINRHYDQLSESDQSVITQIMNERELYATFNCERLAQECHISRASLLRLCHKLDLSGFADLKLLLKETKEQKQKKEYDIYEIYHQLIDALKSFSYHAICEQLYQSPVVYVYGSGNEQKALASELKRIFLTAGKCVIELFDLGEVTFMKPSFHSEDTFIIISLSGENEEGIKILKSIAETNIQTISITRLHNNPISRMCKNQLYVGTKVMEDMNEPYELVTAFYMLLDLLFIHYLDYHREVTHVS